MKRILKIIATVSIVLFVLLWILSYFNFEMEYNTSDIRNVLVVVYLFTSLKYFQLEVSDKNAEIQRLRLKLEKTKK